MKMKQDKHYKMGSNKSRPPSDQSRERYSLPLQPKKRRAMASNRRSSRRRTVAAVIIKNQVVIVIVRDYLQH